ncbi:MAG: DUF4440 domain-containing protein [Planctomycetaceae bacterium]
MPTAPVDPRRSIIAASLVPRLLAGALAIGTVGACAARAADGPETGSLTQAEPPAADGAAIRAAAAAYRAALDKGDAAAIRAAWTADGDVIDAWGNVLPAAQVTQAGNTPAGDVRPEVRVGETRLRRITADVVLEDGSVDIVMPGTTTPLEGRFSAIWVRQGGAWKLAGIRESERPPAVGPDTLDDLEWLVGDWKLEPEDDAAKNPLPAMEMSVRWDAGRMFLVRDVRLTAPGAAADAVPMDVQQRIGWDPLVGRVRSWSFAPDGTRSEATWFRDGTSWVARVTTITADGTQATTAHVYTYDGRDRCAWRTIQEPFATDGGIPVRATWVRAPKGGAK